MTEIVTMEDMRSRIETALKAADDLYWRMLWEAISPNDKSRTLISEGRFGDG